MNTSIIQSSCMDDLDAPKFVSKQRNREVHTVEPGVRKTSRLGGAQQIWKDPDTN